MYKNIKCKIFISDDKAFKFWADFSHFPSVGWANSSHYPLIGSDIFKDIKFHNVNTDNYGGVLTVEFKDEAQLIPFLNSLTDLNITFDFNNYDIEDVINDIKGALKTFEITGGKAIKIKDSIVRYIKSSYQKHKKNILMNEFKSKWEQIKRK